MEKLKLKSSPITEKNKNNQWKIIIADDEASVHSITKMVGENITFDEKGIEFISAYTGEEAIELLKQHPDTAIVLLDVVMETDDAGFKVVEQIRNELKNKAVRVILRTGQPGKVPENLIAKNYGINDYKLKTEITAEGLSATIICSLRSFDEINEMDKKKRGLQNVAKITENIISLQPESIKPFTYGVLLQLSSLLPTYNEQNDLSKGYAIIYKKSDQTLITFLGNEHNAYSKEQIEEILKENIRNYNSSIPLKKVNISYENDSIKVFLDTENDIAVFFNIFEKYNKNNVDKELIEIFLNTISDVYTRIGFVNY